MPTDIESHRGVRIAVRAHPIDESGVKIAARRRRGRIRWDAAAGKHVVCRLKVIERVDHVSISNQNVRIEVPKLVVLKDARASVVRREGVRVCVEQENVGR